MAGQRLAGSDPPARDRPPGGGPLHRPHGQQDLHQHPLAGTQRVEDPQDTHTVELKTCSDLILHHLCCCVCAIFYVNNVLTYRMWYNLDSVCDWMKSSKSISMTLTTGCVARSCRTETAMIVQIIALGRESCCVDLRSI